MKDVDKVKDTYQTDIREIKEWMIKYGNGEPPRFKNAMGEERRLGAILRKIRINIMLPYLKLENQEEKKKYKEKNPEVSELLEIFKIDDSDEIIEKEPLYLLNAREIKEWLEQKGRTKPPSQWSEDLEEARLGRKLNRISCYLIKPYLSLTDEEERIQFISQNPELEGVMKLLCETLRNGNSKSQIRMGERIEAELKKFVAKHVENNHDTRLELVFKEKELDEKANSNLK